jgi:hypothetical protein
MEGRQVHRSREVAVEPIPKLLERRAEPALSLPNVSRPYLEGEAPSEPILGF